MVLHVIVVGNVTTPESVTKLLTEYEIYIAYEISVYSPSPPSINRYELKQSFDVVTPVGSVIN